MRRLALVCTLGTLAATSACATAGPDVRARARLDALQPGMTEQQVVARLGPPNGRVTIRGRTSVMWVRQARSLFAPEEAHTLQLTFDERGRLTSR